MAPGAGWLAPRFPKLVHRLDRNQNSEDAIAIEFIHELGVGDEFPAILESGVRGEGFPIAAGGADGETNDRLFVGVGKDPFKFDPHEGAGVDFGKGFGLLRGITAARVVVDRFNRGEMSVVFKAKDELGVFGFRFVKHLFSLSLPPWGGLGFGGVFLFPRAFHLLRRTAWFVFSSFFLFFPFFSFFFFSFFRFPYY